MLKQLWKSAFFRGRSPAISARLRRQATDAKAQPATAGADNAPKTTVQASLFDLFAEHEIGRELKAMSLDPKYVDVVIRRWQEFCGGAATLDGAGSSFEEIAAGCEASAA